MSGVLCAWAANIPKSSEPWYEDVYIPSMASKLAHHAVHAELVRTGLDAEFEGVGTQEVQWTWLTMYEMDNSNKATDATYDEENHVSMTGDMAAARFDVRTYEMVEKYQAADWEGDHAEIGSVALMEWQIEEGREKEVLEFYVNEVIPTIAVSPDVLRFRLFELQNATVLKAGSYETLDKKILHRYLTLVEMDGEEWPWAAVIAMGEKPEWQEYFEEQKVVKWQSSHYVVRRSYPDGDDKGGGDN